MLALFSNAYAYLVFSKLHRRNLTTPRFLSFIDHKRLDQTPKPHKKHQWECVP